MKHLGRHHPLVKELGRLSQARERRAQRRFLVEGRRGLEELLSSPLLIELLLFSQAPADLLRRAEAAGAELLETAPAVLERLSPAETSQGVLAVVQLPADPLPAVLASPSLLVCEDIGDPGNLGTLLRSARASGTGGVLLVGGTDPYAPKVVRAAAGALFHLPVARTSALPGLEHHEGLALVVEGGENLYTCSLPERPAWMVGSEAGGLSAAARALAQRRLTIPMRSGESVNVAVCASLAMFEWLRRQEVSDQR